jgi:hypothetical protein
MKGGNDVVPKVDIDYEQLPRDVKRNLSPEQWLVAQADVVIEHDTVPETAGYINLRNGWSRQYQAGEPADGPLLPVHDLAGAGGKDSTQFHTTPHSGAS